MSNKQSTNVNINIGENTGKPKAPAIVLIIVAVLTFLGIVVRSCSNKEILKPQIKTEKLKDRLNK